MRPLHLTESIKNEAYQVGFDLVGISPIGVFPESQFYKEWLLKGHAGEMKYMERNPTKRADVRQIVPDAKSVISCGTNYNTPYPYSTDEDDKMRGWIARYAWGDDYHDLMRARLDKLAGYIREQSPHDVDLRHYVDTGPVLERAYGKYAGIGWIGKNACLINQNIGSWVFIGEIITNLELEYDTPAPDRCGTCTRCIDACPTGALLEPYQLDSRRCISYLTIELKGIIPLELREGIDNNIFGCDICQDVCPWNKKAQITQDDSFAPRTGLYNPELSYLSRLSPDDFRGLFKDSPVKRTKRKGFIRNVLIAMGNSGEKKFLPCVEECLSDREPLIRAHAVWALWRIKGSGAEEVLLDLMVKEPDEGVRNEIEAILNIVGS